MKCGSDYTFCDLKNDLKNTNNTNTNITYMNNSFKKINNSVQFSGTSINTYKFNYTVFCFLWKVFYMS